MRRHGLCRLWRRRPAGRGAEGGPNDGSEIWGAVRGADPACTTGAGMTATYDAIIIGTGQAGPFLAHRLTSAGMRVAIIERGAFGGTCVNTGCIPTKALVASAYPHGPPRERLRGGCWPRNRRHEAREGPQGRDRGSVADRRRDLVGDHGAVHRPTGGRGTQLASIQSGPGARSLTVWSCRRPAGRG